MPTYFALLCVFVPSSTLSFVLGLYDGTRKPFMIGEPHTDELVQLQQILNTVNAAGWLRQRSSARFFSHAWTHILSVHIRIWWFQVVLFFHLLVYYIQVPFKRFDFLVHIKNVGFFFRRRLAYSFQNTLNLPEGFFSILNALVDFFFHAASCANGGRSTWYRLWWIASGLRTWTYYTCFLLRILALEE